ncbi:MAG: hypothetical protein WBM44_02245 [Waterburya sp.]
MITVDLIFIFLTIFLTAPPSSGAALLVALVHQQQTLGKYNVNFTGREDYSGYQLLPKFLTFYGDVDLKHETDK